MDEYCKYCVHFFMHYVAHKGDFMAIDFRYCVFPRVKPRDAMTKACVHFRAVDKLTDRT